MTSRFKEIGRIGRARGLEGWVLLLPEQAVTEDFLSSNPVVYIKNDRSGLEPLRVVEYYTEEKRNRVSFFVKFDMITNRTEADALKNKGLFSDQFDPDIETDEQDSSAESDLTGYSVQYRSKTAGYVLDRFETPAQSIIEAKIGAGSLLIPFVDEYVSEVDHNERTIFCRNLNQLMDDE